MVSAKLSVFASPVTHPATFFTELCAANTVGCETVGHHVRIPAKEIAHSDLMSIKIEASSRWTVIC
jgi:hypothetical protein